MEKRAPHKEKEVEKATQIYFYFYGGERILLPPISLWAPLLQVCSLRQNNNVVDDQDLTCADLTIMIAWTLLHHCSL